MFKNLMAYAFEMNDNFNNLPDLLNNSDCCYDGLSEYQQFGSGFSVIDNDLRVIESDNRTLLKYRSDERKINKNTIKNIVIERINKLEQIAPVNAATQTDIEEGVRRECMKYASISSKLIYLLIDKNAHRIYVSVASYNDAESALSCLRNVLGSLHAKPICYPRADRDFYLAAFKGKELPPEFIISLSPEIQVFDEDGATAKFKGIIYPDDDVAIAVASMPYIKILSMELVGKFDASFDIQTHKDGYIYIKNYHYDDIQLKHNSDENYHQILISKMFLIGKTATIIFDSLIKFFRDNNK